MDECSRHYRIYQFWRRDCSAGAPACHLIGKRERLLYSAAITAKPADKIGIASELRRLLGNDAVADDPQTLADHSGDKWFAHETPEVVVFAGWSNSQVKKLLRFC